MHRKATSASRRRLQSWALPLAVACSGTVLFVTPAAAQPPPPGTGGPDAGANAAPTIAVQTPGAGPVDRTQPVPPNVVEAAQRSIVGVVTLWQEPEDLWAWLSFEPADPDAETEAKPVMSLCTGFFDTPSTIVTAGHCVDPAEGRQALDMQQLEFDPDTGMPIPPPPGGPEPERKVLVFQPRELPGRVIQAPTEARVHSFRPAEDGDTAKIELHGLPPGPPLAIAAAEPALGEDVTSIGFPGFSVSQTDGVDLDALLNGTNPAKTLEDSRLQPVSSSGTITARQFQNGSAVFQTNADLAPGNSGGPALNSRGKVVGVNSQMSVPFFTQNFNIITNTGMLREFLGHDTQPAAPTLPEPTRGANPAPGPAPQQPTSQTTPQLGGLPADWLTPIPLVGTALLGGLLAWVLTRYRKRSASRHGRDASAAVAAVPEQPTAPGTPRPDKPSPSGPDDAADGDAGHPVGQDGPERRTSEPSMA